MSKIKYLYKTKLAGETKILQQSPIPILMMETELNFAGLSHFIFLSNISLLWLKRHESSQMCHGIWNF